MCRRAFAIFLASFVISLSMNSSVFAEENADTADITEETAEYEQEYDAEEGDFQYRISEGEAVITEYTGDESIVTIPSELGGYPVTVIEDAFYNNTGITDVTIPEGVTALGSYAFSSCADLSHIVIPGSLREIGSSAFSLCTSLSEVILPEGVESIGQAAFGSCTGLTHAVIPGSVETMDSQVFGGCENLKTAGPAGSGSDIEFGWTDTIPDKAFWWCDTLTSVTIPEGITKIGYGAFYGCTALTRLTIPSTAEVLDTYLYTDCPGLKTAGPAGSGSNIEFGWTEVIPENAFWGCTALTSVTIPEGIREIGDLAFRDCTNLTSLNIPGSVSAVEEYTFLECAGLKTAGPYGSGKNIEIGWTDVIPEEAFYKHKYLEELIIPDGVVSIGQSAFRACTNLKYVYIPSSVSGAGRLAFNRCVNLETAGPEGSGSDVEFGWTESIPSEVFGTFSDLKSIVIPEGVAAIKNKAFGNCRGLTYLSLPGSIVSMGSNVYENCKNLVSAGPEGSGSSIEYGWTEIPADAFRDCDSLVSVTVDDSVVSIAEGAFDSCDWVRELHIESVKGWLDTELAFYSSHPLYCADDGKIFIGDEEISRLVIPEGTEEVSDFQFFHCSNLTDISFPESLVRIGTDAFSGCGSLKEVLLGSQVKTIGHTAFKNCVSLEHVVIPESADAVDFGIFEKCPLLQSAGPFGSGNHIEYGWKERIPENIFYDCSSLQIISLPGSLTSVGINAFYKCEGLREVHYYGTEDQWNAVRIPFGNDPLKNAQIIFHYEKPSAIDIADGEEIVMPTDSTRALAVNVYPAGSFADIIWSSSNEKVAAVDENGVVTAKSYGKAVITAVSASDPELNASCEVQTRFFDVDDSSQSYYKPVYWGADKGIVAGFSGGEYFGPDMDCTRAQFVTFLWRLAGKPSGTKDVSFPDVDPKANYYRAVKWAVSQGIIVGFKHEGAPSTFEPDGVVTRGQVATMLWRYGGRRTPKAGANFKDLKSADSIYRAVSWGTGSRHHQGI